MIDLWRRHVAWRLVSTDKARRRWLVSDTMQRLDAAIACIPKADGRPCTRCREPVEDKAFKMCLACRAQANKTAKRRARKLKRESRCPKCAGPGGSETIVCSPCLASQRAHYHARGKVGA